MKTFKPESARTKHNLQKLFVAGVTMLALSGIQTANAQSFIDRAFDKLAKVNDKMIDISNDIDWKKREIQKTEYYANRLDQGTGNILSGSVNIVKGLINKNKQKKMAREQAASLENVNETMENASTVSTPTRVVESSGSSQKATKQLTVEEIEAAFVKVKAREAALQAEKSGGNRAETPQKSVQGKQVKEISADALYAQMKREGYLK